MALVGGASLGPPLQGAGGQHGVAVAGCPRLV